MTFRLLHDAGLLGRGRVYGITVSWRTTTRSYISSTSHTRPLIGSTDVGLSFHCCGAISRVSAAGGVLAISPDFANRLAIGADPWPDWLLEMSASISRQDVHQRNARLFGALFRDRRP